MSTYPIAPRTLLTQVTVPANSGVFTSLRALLPAGTLADLGRREILAADLMPQSVAVDVRSNATLPGRQLAAGSEKHFPGNLIDQDLLLRSSTGSTAVMEVVLYVSPREV